MNRHICTRRTLGLAIRSFANVEPVFIPRRSLYESSQPPQSPKFPVPENDEETLLRRERERPAWQIQKEALREKLGGEAWNPRKKLSPDTMDGIRHLHNSQPDKFTTPVLANHFKVSPEAIRRILKSKWRPSDEEQDARNERWDKRGERIWTNMVEMGIKPPKKWRDMGVGRAENGERPVWKSRPRNMIEIRDSAPEELVPEEDIIPTAESSGKPKPRVNIPLSERL
ncbi:hypothetical protein P153DRAFT_313138 [Dothidotthia symphoricarpi CBS 119687]|uniref:Required for respiratory growth protein 9, mitochondrial n=1 Tax=Dothidotthia symphoricarpi CBS 119687 TaxID=1392245 RepID=A0A6A6AIN5_9PLEO|nr:uncharacterized protein P153DRAFT_313138 [Dothidotthia symphoricarpi CBS 119687]KAF2130965.1 hypothetical protein P153DRAFT_313138 [Dothidotthia symphoricarpi CBS 119687]